MRDQTPNEARTPRGGPDPERSPGPARGPAQEEIPTAPSAGPTAGPVVSIGVQAARRYALAFGFGVLSIGILVLLVAIYLQIAYEILWAVSLAALFYPLHRQITRLVGGRRTLASAISTVVSLAIVFLPAFLLAFNLLGEVRNLWPTLRDGMGQNSFEAIARWLERSAFRAPAHLLLGQEPSTGAAGLQIEIERAAIWVQEFFLDHLRSITKGAPTALFQLIVTLFAFFFFLRHGPGWIQDVQNALPLERQHSARLFGIAGQTVNAVFRGVILTAGAQAVLAGLGFWICGAKIPILLASLTFIGSMIPFVGAAGVWAPTAAALFLTGHRTAGIGLALYGVLVVSIADNFIKPYVIGRHMKLPTLWLFLAIVGALKLFGVLGIILGPAALSLGFAVFRIYTEGRKGIVSP
jgi:predicted PurR-regulated permease PerM